MRALLRVLLGIFLVGHGALGATFTVTNTDDSGPGSLRQAISDANASANAPANQPDRIHFAIPGLNVHTIAPLSALPPLLDSVVIDGYTQTGSSPNTLPIGSNAALRIELNGAVAGSAVHALAIVAESSTVRGLVINRFSGCGVRISGSSSNGRISGCYIGTNAAGAAALPNGTGVEIEEPGNATIIGGSAPDDRNVISGNGTGIVIRERGGAGSAIEGNYIGTHRNGLDPLLNSSFTIRLEMTADIRIGGVTAGTRNVIYGDISVVSGGRIVIQGNYVGVRADGSAAPAPVVGRIGFGGGSENIVGGPVIAARNVVATKIEIHGSVGNTIQGNYVGVDASGVAVTGSSAGVLIETAGAGIPRTHATDNLVDGNVICGSSGDGVAILRSGGNIVRRNFIGVGADGTTPLGCVRNGVYLDAGNIVGGTAEGEGNLIAFNGTGQTKNDRGVRSGSGTRINGNSIYANNGRGIDIVYIDEDPAPGVTPNDRTDADLVQNFPILTFASFSNGSVQVAGTLESKATSDYRVEIFASGEADNSGYGEGQYYLGATTVNTDASGFASFEATFAVPANARILSATATSASGNTSEFSPTFFGRLQNISTRARVHAGDNVMIGGFIISGSDPKWVMVRAIGPSLEISGVPFIGRLEDPMLDLYDGNGLLIRRNDNWRDTQQAEIEETGIAPKDDRESAIVQTLAPGNYTAAMSGRNGTTGVGVVEVYDLGAAAAERLANISTRAFVETGENVMIGGFIIGPGEGGARVLVRGIGPSLAESGVSNAMQDPVLELRDASGALRAANDDWRQNQTQVEATGAAPAHDRESALVTDLPAGSYTVILRGKAETTGVALVEVYHLQ